MLHRVFFVFLVLIALIYELAVGQFASVHEKPQVRLDSLDQTTQMHMEILTRLSEIHREKAAQVATLDQRRTELMQEIAELTERRETGMLDQPQDREGAETERGKPSRKAIASVVAERSPGPPSGDQSPLQVSSTAMQLKPASISRPRVLLNYSPNKERARAVAARISQQLTQNGYSVADVRGVNVQMSSPSIRYFFPEDRSVSTMASEIVAASLGERGVAPSRVRVQNFTWASKKPVHGTLEVWIPVE